MPGMRRRRQSQSAWATTCPALSRSPAPIARLTCAPSPVLTRFARANAIQSVNIEGTMAAVAHAPSEPVHGSVGADDAVAGNDDGDPGGAVGGPDRSNRVRPADGAGDLRVRACLTEGDRGERAPDRLLKSGSGGQEIELEFAAP